MHQIRLIGLVLFITTAFLAMATAVTKTTHIRFKRPNREANGRLIQEQPPRAPQSTIGSGAVLPPEPGQPKASTSNSVEEMRSAKLQFVAVPVIYPLLVAGSLGLVLWFAPTSLSRPKPTRRRRRR